jgi:hypothetical protein
MVAPTEVREPFSVDYDAAPLHRSALFSGTIIRTRGDRYVFDRLGDHTGYERLHRHVFQRCFHAKLPVDFLGQVDVNFASPDRRFPNCSHDNWYIYTESTRSQYLPRVHPLTRPDATCVSVPYCSEWSRELHWHAAPSAWPKSSFVTSVQHSASRVSDLRGALLSGERAPRKKFRGNESNTQHALPMTGSGRKRTRRFGVMPVNKVIVIGNLRANPNIRALPSGQNVANFSLATTERFTDRSGANRHLNASKIRCG